MGNSPSTTEEVMEDYIKGDLLSSGAFCTIHIATLKSSNEKFAMKIINKVHEIDVITPGGGIKKEQINETKTLASLSHPNIVKFKESFQHNCKLHIVMEHCGGGNLKDYIEKVKREYLIFPEDRIMKWVKQLCEGLAYIHSQNYMHLGIEPANIFLTSDKCEVKIGDFSKAYNSTDLTCKLSDITLYYAPEMCESNWLDLDNKVDTWGLGIVTYELAQLEFPFKGITESTGKLDKNKLREKQRSSDNKPIPDCYSSELRELIKEMLQSENGNRPTISSILMKPFVQNPCMEDYIPEKLVNRGGFGTALLMRQRTNDEKVVIKVIEHGDTREIEILERLAHPNITNFKTSFKHNGKFHIVMEYCAGGDLNDYILLKKKEVGLRIPEKDIMRWLTQLCDALRYIHSKNYIHRDIKPGNIFLTGDGNEVKLGDFGVSRTLAYTSQPAGTAIGTHLYYAPETCKGEPYDNKVDTWGLGIVIYQLCTLEYPFKDISEVKEDKSEVNTNKLLEKQWESDYVPISDHYSSDLKDLIQEMLQFRHQVRPSMSSILEKPLLVKAAAEEKIRMDIELYNAARAGDAKRVEAALKYKPDINWGNPDECGRTPLWIASMGGHADVVKLLLDRDAEVNKATNAGATPLWAARFFKHSAVEAILEAAGGRMPELK